MSITTALSARRDALRDREAGFTLIELLVVVLIIGILAAIAIPVYVGVQNGAKDSGVQSDMASDKIAIAAYISSNPDQTTLPALPTVSTAADATAVKANGFTYDAKNYAVASGGKAPSFKTGSTPSAWCLEGISSQKTTFSVSTNKGVQKAACSATTTAW